MKHLKHTFLFSLLCLASMAVNAQCSFKNKAFKSGEYLSYNLYFNWKFVWVKAGNASMSTVQTIHKGKPAYRCSLIASGNNRADKLFKLRDTVQSYTTLDLQPLFYRKAAVEGSRYYVDEIFYSYPGGKCNIKQHELTSSGEHLYRQKAFNDCVFDMVSILMRARSFDFSRYKAGQVISFPMASAKDVSYARLVYRGKKNIKVDNGKTYRCIKIDYMEKKEGKYKSVVDFYITDDANQAPIRLDMHLNFGVAKAYLVRMKGLRHQG